VHLLYLALLAGCLAVTAPLEFLLGARVYRRWTLLLAAVLPVAGAFVALDALAVHLGWWHFSARYVVHLPRLFGLPVEEVLFFLVVPTCAVLTLEAVRRLRPGWFTDG
jgi:lycopene beta-cyclase